MKHEIRSTKSEININSKEGMTKTIHVKIVSVLWISDFEFVSNFALRISRTVGLAVNPIR
jgi:hypothetical protein